MRTERGLLLSVVLVGVVAGTGFAAPLVGLYTDAEWGGVVLDGRYTESYVGGGPRQIGNTMHAASWDGSALATMWEIAGPAVDATPTMIYSDLVGGTGAVIYRVTYTGGTMTLENTGPWWDAGDTGSYVVDITNYTHKTTLEYVGGNLLYQYSEVRFDGTFQGYSRELAYEVLVAVPHGTGSAVPANYPDWIPSTASLGEWGGVQKIRLEIVPEPATVAVLALGAVAVIRRRKR